MTDDIQIQCINKSDGLAPHERIRSVGGKNPDGAGWKLSLARAIEGTKEGAWRFWTSGGGKNVWVVIAKTPTGDEYLKTEADDIQPDNLLALPDCP